MKDPINIIAEPKTADDRGGFVAGDDRLRPTACPRCDYALAGLPAVGTCPECGRPYGGPEVCLYGYGTGSRASDWTRPPPTRRRLAWQWVWTVAVTAVFAWLWRWQPLVRMYWYWPASIVAGLAITTWRGMIEQPPDAVQVRLTPTGVKQLARGWGPIPYDRIDRAELVPWRKVGWIAVEPATDGRLHVTMSSSKDRWTFQRVYVDAVLRWPPENSAALRDRINQWRTLPKGPVSPA